MNPFQYVTAHTPDEAISLIGKNGRYLGGGIDLLGEMKEYIVSPDVVVDVKEIAEAGVKGTVVPETTVKTSPILAIDESVLRTAPLPGSGANFAGGAKAQLDFWQIGSLTTIAEISDHPDIKAKLPGLAEAAAEVGSPQIRNVATLGGNLLQHSRCWYYRQPDIVCLKRGGATCYGQDGENKYLSLFSGCKCITAFTSNLGVMLSALDASVFVKKVSGEKAMGPPLSLRSLYAEAWSSPLAHNSLHSSDFVHSVFIPYNRTRSAYRQVSEKSEFDWALVSCAAAGNVTDGKITDARVVLGAVAPVPYMVPEANQFLEGKPLTDETASQAADIILKDAKPLAHNGYKVPLAHTLIRRTLLALNP